MRTRSLGSEHLVLDVGSGGGRRLRPYVDAEVPVLGIEPDRARARLAEDLGVPTTPAWFDAALGARLASEGRRGDVVHAHGVLDRVPDPFDFAQGLVHAVARDGVVVVEVPYVFGVGAPLPARPRYFSLTSLTTLLGAAGLFVVDVDVDGGQLLAEASPARPVAPPASDAVSALAFREAQLDPARVESYAPRFSPRPEGPGLQTPHPTAWSGAAPEGDPT